MFLKLKDTQSMLSRLELFEQEVKAKQKILKKILL